MKQCVIVMGIAIGLGAPSVFAQSPADKPNIVFILADDMSFDSVSANNPKMGTLKTPHIDRRPCSWIGQAGVAGTGSP